MPVFLCLGGLPLVLLGEWSRTVDRRLRDAERGGLASLPASRAVKGVRLEVVTDRGRAPLSWVTLHEVGAGALYLQEPHDGKPPFQGSDAGWSRVQPRSGEPLWWADPCARLVYWLAPVRWESPSLCL